MMNIMDKEKIMKEKILITGAAGFIGFHLSNLLAKNNVEIIGIDNLNDYYDVSLKKERLKILNENPNFKFIKLDLKDKNNIDKLFSDEKFDIIINLAAQAGVRYSITNPDAYVDSNLIGFMNILEACRHNPVKHLLYASSSSVYGGNKVAPFSENHNVDHPVSLYAATKKSNELMAHTYSHLYGIPTTGLRFFTVYGPWGRPDMAYFLFANKIISGKNIDVYNHGKMERDFTYIDDIVNGISKLISKVPNSNHNWDETTDTTSSSFAPYRILNVGNSEPVQLLDFISILEKELEKTANKNFTDMQPGDVLKTYADVTELKKIIGDFPSTSIENGIKEFVIWYRNYYKI